MSKWDMVAFDEAINDVTKFATKIKKEDYLPNGQYQIIDQGKEYLAGYANNLKGLYVDVPVIVFGDHTRILKYIDEPLFIGADGVKLLKTKGNNLNTKFVYYYLTSCRVIDTGYNRHFKWLKEFNIPLPPLPTQQKIADVLDRASALIEKRRSHIAKLDLLVKSRFVEMFGDPVRNPMGWEVRQINKFATVRIGPFGSLLHAEDYIEGGFPIVNPSHIIDSKIVTDSKLTLTSEKYNELSAYALRCGDVVLGRRGEIGRCAVIEDDDYLCGTGSMFIRIERDYLPMILQRVISSDAMRRVLEDKAVGITMLNLNSNMISNLNVIVPPLHLQTQFADFVRAVDKSKAEMQAGLERLELLYRSLMQKCFNQEIFN
ncbi:MAG: restriction endonuclease subunit S [Oscillospiraceae bacterium]|nr:restriction endonuclease subunit S [Oscillospiraceae bacterium]